MSLFSIVALVAIGAILGSYLTILWIDRVRSQRRTKACDSANKLKVRAHQSSVRADSPQTERENGLLTRLTTLAAGRMNRLDPSPLVGYQIHRRDGGNSLPSWTTSLKSWRRHTDCRTNQTAHCRSIAQ
jgi:hypothetical protein